MPRPLLFVVLCLCASSFAYLAPDDIMSAELRNHLGNGWTVRKSGSGFLATRVKPRDGEPARLGDQLRDFRKQYPDAQASRRGDEVTLRGRIDDCDDAARAAAGLAEVDGVNQLFFDISCSTS